MQSCVQIFHLCVAAVNCKGILGQIVCANAEKCSFLCKQICNQGSSWCFNHNANLDIIIICNTLCCKFLFAFFQQLFCCADFLYTSYQWQHDLDVLVLSTSTKQCTNLNFKQIAFFQTVTDCTPSKEWVLLGFHLEIRNLFVSANIQSTDDNLFSLHDVRYCLICFVLFLFGWHCGAVHEEELGSEQTDSFCTIFQRNLSFCYTSDIGIKLIISTVCILSFTVTVNRKHCFLFLLFFPLCCIAL